MKYEYLFILFIIFLILYNEQLDLKFLTILLLLFYIYNEYFLKNYKEKINHNEKNKKEKNDNLLIKYNDKLSNYFHKLKKYRKNDIKTYDEGIFYWKKFIKNLMKTNEKNNNSNQYFENTEYYLKKSINIFQSMSINIKERTYIDGLKSNNFEGAKNTNDLSKLIRKIYKEGYQLLYNLSLQLNKNWKENPNINNKEIILDPLPSNNMLDNDFNNIYL